MRLALKIYFLAVYPCFSATPVDEVCLSPWDPVLQPQQYCCQEAFAKFEPQFEFQASTSAANTPTPGQADVSVGVTGNRSVGTQHHSSVSFTFHANVVSSVWEVDRTGVGLFVFGVFCMFGLFCLILCLEISLLFPAEMSFWPVHTLLVLAFTLD